MSRVTVLQSKLLFLISLQFNFHWVLPSTFIAVQFIKDGGVRRSDSYVTDGLFAYGHWSSTECVALRSHRLENLKGIGYMYWGVQKVLQGFECLPLLKEALTCQMPRFRHQIKRKQIGFHKQQPTIFETAAIAEQPYTNHIGSYVLECAEPPSIVSLLSFRPLCSSSSTWVSVVDMQQCHLLHYLLQMVRAIRWRQLLLGGLLSLLTFR